MVCMIDCTVVGKDLKKKRPFQNASFCRCIFLFSNQLNEAMSVSDVTVDTCGYILVEIGAFFCIIIVRITSIPAKANAAGEIGVVLCWINCLLVHYIAPTVRYKHFQFNSIDC